MLPGREELIAKSYPFGQAMGVIPMGDPSEEHLRTGPDYIAYLPHRTDGSDRDNEHFLVVPLKSGKRLFAMWMQSSVEGRGDNHIVCSFSDNCSDWSEPTLLAGTVPEKTGEAAYCGFPIVSASGRLYLFYAHGAPAEHWDMMCTFSDDEGRSFSPPVCLPLPEAREGLWIIWQVPQKCTDGAYLAGCTVWYGNAVPNTNWCHRESVSVILAFENIDDDPLPQDIRLSWRTREPLTVPDPAFPDMSVAQEPALAELPDGRIWVQMRTMCDSPYWAVSSDGGRTFTRPKRMLFPDGSPVLHPLSPAPIYRWGEGKYLILVHQNDGRRLGFDHHPLQWPANVANFVRNPYYLCKAYFDKDAPQPLRIEAPVKIIDTGDIAVGPKKTAEGGTYSSFTIWNDQAVLWYPDRKYYLLGKRLDRYGIIPEE